MGQCFISQEWIVISVDNLIDKQESSERFLNKEDESKLKELFTMEVPSLHVTVESEGFEPGSTTCCCYTPGIHASYEDMAALGGQMGRFLRQYAG